jgi:glyoxylate reductase
MRSRGAGGIWRIMVSYWSPPRYYCWIVSVTPFTPAYLKAQSEIKYISDQAKIPWFSISNELSGAGYDQIVQDACSKRDPPLLVSNIPSVPDDATADTAIFLMLGVLRNFNTSMAALRRGDWRGQPPPGLGHDPQGKTLGILGMGGIGRNMKRKADVFGMTTIYHNRRKLDPDMANGAEYVSFEKLLQTSDVLSLNLPQNAKTRHIISKEQFKMMKPSCVIVNTARGPVMDEAALVDALDQGLIAGAGLDVYEEEPKVHPGLVKNEKVMLLPHMGTWTRETQEKMECWTIDNIRSALTGKGLLSMINEQKDLGLDRQN